MRVNCFRLDKLKFSLTAHSDKLFSESSLNTSISPGPAPVTHLLEIFHTLTPKKHVFFLLKETSESSMFIWIFGGVFSLPREGQRDFQAQLLPPKAYVMTYLTYIKSKKPGFGAQSPGFVLVSPQSPCPHSSPVNKQLKPARLKKKLEGAEPLSFIHSGQTTWRRRRRRRMHLSVTA